METKPAALSPELVQAFVGNAHGDLNRVRELLARQPMLVNAAWDWGGGDWETALGAASHMGRVDIARYLLAHGARMDIFAATMLGEIAIVRAMLAAFPAMSHQAGPHGIPLLEHARAGGDAATPVMDYLHSLGAEPAEK